MEAAHQLAGQEAAGRCRRFDLGWCRNAVALAAEADLAMKSSGADGEELLVDLLLKLACC